MEDYKQRLVDALIECYGTQIEEDIPIILEKMAIMMGAHLYHGEQGDHILCNVNRIFNDIMSKNQ